MEVQHVRVLPNRVALSIVLAAGLAAGLLPFLLYLHVTYLALPYFLYAAVVVWWTVRGFTGNATEPPEPLEWALAGWNAVAVGASSGMIGFIWYGLAYVVAWLAAFAADAVGSALELNPTSLATYPCVLFGGLLALAAPFIVADQLPPKLYPRIAGTRSIYFPFIVNPWKLAMLAVLGVAGVAVAAAFLDPQGTWFAVLLTGFIVGTGGPLFKVTETERSSDGAVLVMKALSKLLSAAGYQLTEKPRTGSPEIDPLITPVDLLAFAGNRGYAIKVKVVASGDADLEWMAASDIRRAAKALQRALRSDNAAEVGIDAYLLVVGGRISDDLRSFADEENVKLVHFPGMDSLTAALKPEATASDLRGIAERVLQVPPGMPAENAPSMRATA